MKSKKNNYIILLVAMIFLNDYWLTSFDILPDFIGYALFTYSMYSMQEESKYYNKAKKLGYILLGLSILDIYRFNFIPSYAYTIIILLTMIISAIAIYNLCSGVLDISLSIANDKIYSSSMKVWKWFFGTQFAIVALLLFSNMIASLIATVIAFIAYLRIMILMYQCYNEEILLQKD